MRKLIETKGEAIVATAFVAFALGYGLSVCEVNSFFSGFASGVGAIVAAVMWFE